MASIKCRFCGSRLCENGDHCPECGCPRCGYPGVRFVEPDTGTARGFCSDPDCNYELVPGAFDAWKARQPKLSSFQLINEMRRIAGLPQKVDDVVGKPIIG